MRIKIGDEVEVISGEDKGLRGTVQRVDTKKNRLVVSGINICWSAHRQMNRPASASAGMKTVRQLDIRKKAAKI